MADEAGQGAGMHGVRTRPARCQETGKVRFRDRKDARIALRSAVHVRGHEARRAAEVLEPPAPGWGTGVAEPVRRREVRAYKCTACQGWHLTSQRHRYRLQWALPDRDAA